MIPAIITDVLDVDYIRYLEKMVNFFILPENYSIPTPKYGYIKKEPSRVINSTGFYFLFKYKILCNLFSYGLLTTAVHTITDHSHHQYHPAQRD